MIKIHNLTYRYPDGHMALKGLNCHIKSGECVALLGANGAGKSTLLSTLSGILQPHAGELLIDDLRWEKGRFFELRQIVGVIFQRPDDQLLAHTVAEDVAFGPRNLGLKSEEIISRTQEALALLNITHLQKRSPQRLSEGEKRLAAIAGVLAMNPKLLLFDEPTSQLDPRARRELALTVAQLPQTKIIATHDLEFAQKLCSRAIILHRGELVFDGAFEDIIAQKSLMEEYSLA